MAIKQKDAVFAALQAAQEQGLDGSAAQEFAVEQVKSGLMSGEITHSKGALDEKGAKTYAKALIGNWSKKDTRLTNGQKYVPATKRGPIVKDEQLVQLRDNLKSLETHGADADLIARTRAAYEARKAIVDSEKATKKVKPLDETMASLAALGIDVEAAG